jgi:hypothetical protein
MSVLSNSLRYTLQKMNESPITQITDVNSEGYRTVTLTWPEDANKIFKFEIYHEEGCTLACILEREIVTYGWGETFMTHLYAAVDLYDKMPPLEDVCACGEVCAQGSNNCYTCINGQRSNAYAQ